MLIWLYILTLGILDFVILLTITNTAPLALATALVASIIRRLVYSLSRLSLKWVVLEWRSWIGHIIIQIFLIAAGLFANGYWATLFLKYRAESHTVEFGLFLLLQLTWIVFSIFICHARTIIPDWYAWYIEKKDLASLNQQQQVLILDQEYRINRILLNPHTLTNELSVLHAKALAQDRNLPDCIVDLSRVMRQYLDDGNRGYVCISDEIKNINLYLSYRSNLHQIHQLFLEIKI